MIFILSLLTIPGVAAEDDLTTPLPVGGALLELNDSQLEALRAEAMSSKLGLGDLTRGELALLGPVFVDQFMQEKFFVTGQEDYEGVIDVFVYYFDFMNKDAFRQNPLYKIYPARDPAKETFYADREIVDIPSIPSSADELSPAEVAFLEYYQQAMQFLLEEDIRNLKYFSREDFSILVYNDFDFLIQKMNEAVLEDPNSVMEIIEGYYGHVMPEKSFLYFNRKLGSNPRHFITPIEQSIFFSHRYFIGATDQLFFNQLFVEPGSIDEIFVLEKHAGHRLFIKSYIWQGSFAKVEEDIEHNFDKGTSRNVRFVITGIDNIRPDYDVLSYYPGLMLDYSQTKGLDTELLFSFQTHEKNVPFLIFTKKSLIVYNLYPKRKLHCEVGIISGEEYAEESFKIRNNHALIIPYPQLESDAQLRNYVFNGRRIKQGSYSFFIESQDHYSLKNFRNDASITFMQKKSPQLFIDAVDRVTINITSSDGAKGSVEVNQKKKVEVQGDISTTNILVQQQDGKTVFVTDDLVAVGPSDYYSQMILLIKKNQKQINEHCAPWQSLCDDLVERRAELKIVLAHYMGWIGDEEFEELLDVRIASSIENAAQPSARERRKLWGEKEFPTTFSALPRKGYLPQVYSPGGENYYALLTDLTEQINQKCSQGVTADCKKILAERSALLAQMEKSGVRSDLWSKPPGYASFDDYWDSLAQEELLETYGPYELSEIEIIAESQVPEVVTKQARSVQSTGTQLENSVDIDFDELTDRCICWHLDKDDPKKYYECEPKTAVTPDLNVGCPCCVKDRKARGIAEKMEQDESPSQFSQDDLAQGTASENETLQDENLTRSPIQEIAPLDPLEFIPQIPFSPLVPELAEKQSILPSLLPFFEDVEKYTSFSIEQGEIVPVRYREKFKELFFEGEVNIARDSYSTNGQGGFALTTDSYLNDFTVLDDVDFIVTLTPIEILSFEGTTVEVLVQKETTITTDTTIQATSQHQLFKLFLKTENDQILQPNSSFQEIRIDGIYPLSELLVEELVEREEYVVARLDPVSAPLINVSTELHETLLRAYEQVETFANIDENQLIPVMLGYTVYYIEVDHQDEIKIHDAITQVPRSEIQRMQSLFPLIELSSSVDKDFVIAPRTRYNISPFGARYEPERPIVMEILPAKPFSLPGQIPQVLKRDDFAVSSKTIIERDFSQLKKVKPISIRSIDVSHKDMEITRRQTSYDVAFVQKEELQEEHEEQKDSRADGSQISSQQSSGQSQMPATSSASSDGILSTETRLDISSRTQFPFMATKFHQEWWVPPSDMPFDSLNSALNYAYEDIEGEVGNLPIGTKVLIILGANQRLYEVSKDDFGSIHIHDEISISTGKNGFSNIGATQTSPVGVHKITQKIGEGKPLGALFKYKKYQGIELPIYTGDETKLFSSTNSFSTASKDAYVLVSGPEELIGKTAHVITRAFVLKGIETLNDNTFERAIYIHGTDMELLLGEPASGGCIRMGNQDIVNLFDRTRVDTFLNIIPGNPLYDSIGGETELLIAKEPPLRHSTPTAQTDGSLQGKIIVLDPGHGGTDPGAVVNTVSGQITEREINLAFAKWAKESLELSGATVYLTRTDKRRLMDVFSAYKKDYTGDGLINHKDENYARNEYAKAKNADLLLSIHANALGQYTRDGHKKGVETYVGCYCKETSRNNGAKDYCVYEEDSQQQYKDTLNKFSTVDRGFYLDDSYRLATLLVNTFSSAMGFVSSPVKCGDLGILTGFDGETETAVYDLYHPEFPSVLIELGYMTDQTDIIKLTSETYQFKGGYALGEAITAFLKDDQDTPLLAFESFEQTFWPDQGVLPTNGPSPFGYGKYSFVDENLQQTQELTYEDTKFSQRVNTIGSGANDLQTSVETGAIRQTSFSSRLLDDYSMKFDLVEDGRIPYIIIYNNRDPDYVDFYPKTILQTIGYLKDEGKPFLLALPLDDHINRVTYYTQDTFVDMEAINDVYYSYLNQNWVFVWNLLPKLIQYPGSAKGDLDQISVHLVLDDLSYNLATMDGYDEYLDKALQDSGLSRDQIYIYNYNPEQRELRTIAQVRTIAVPEIEVTS